MLLKQHAPNGFKEVKFLSKIEYMPEDWLFEKLESMGDIVGGGTPDTTVEDYWNGDIPWAVPTDTTTLSSNLISKTERQITRKGLQNSSAKLLPSGTILITSRATIGECAINSIPMATNQGFQSLVCNHNYDNLFMLYALTFNKDKLMRLAYGTTFLEIPKTEMKKIRIAVPHKIEQQKIASILSKMDNLIQKTEEVIDHTRRFKKGLMQWLLTKGIGHTKFRPVRFLPRYVKMQIPEDWTFTRIGDICITSSGGTPNREIKGYYGGNIPWIKTGELKDGFLYDTEEHITEKGLAASSAKNFPPNTVLVAMYGATIGKTCITRIKATTNQACCALLPKSPKTVEPYYLQQYLILMRPLIVSLGEGAGQPNTSADFLQNFQVALPSFEEQEQISAILSLLDTSIQTTQKYREGLTMLKKGLMQQLLKGQIRVKV